MRIQLLNRRVFILSSPAAALALVAPTVHGAQSNQEPWSSGQLMSADELARILKTKDNSPHIICVTFPILFRQKHISHATLAGPGNKPEGLNELRRVTEKLSRQSEIVLYCGCCPMKDCPNIRPAFRVLTDQKFERVRVLNLATNFHTDWVAKGYPSET